MVTRGQGAGDSHVKGGDSHCAYILGVRNAVLVPVRVITLERSTAGAFVVPFRVLSRKKNFRRECFVLELVPHQGEKQFKPQP